MPGEGETVVKLSRVKIVMVSAISVLFVLFGLALIASAAEYDAPFSVFVVLVGLNALILFGICGLQALGKLFDSKPGLIVDSKGISDNSGALALGLIPWEGVKNIKVTEVSWQKFLTVEVSNPQEFVSRASLWKRWFAWVAWKIYGSPVLISVMTLGCKFETLYELVKNAWEEHRRRL